MAIVLKYLFRKLSDLPTLNSAGVEKRRLLNRRLATMCVPGGGKTYAISSFFLRIDRFFFDVLSSMPSWSEEVYSEYLSLMKNDTYVDYLPVDEKKFPEFQQWLQNTIFLPVSFSGGTTCLPGDSSWQIQFCSRLCYAYLFDIVESFQKFYFAFKEFVQTHSLNDRLLPLVIHSLVHYETKILGRESKLVNFVILVDEIAKLRLEEKEFTSMISSIVWIMDCSQSLAPCYSVLISSLEVIDLKNRLRTTIQRGISFIPLPYPGMKIAIKLFEKDIDFSSPNDLNAVVWMASCHWRSLKAIKMTLPELQRLKSFSSIVDRVLKCSLSCTFPVELGEKCIVEAVLAKPVAWDTVLLCGKTFQDCVAHGYFVNSATDQDRRAIPIVSVLKIEEWARVGLLRENHLARLFAEMFKTDSPRGDCFTYEIFHCYWEAIRYYSIVVSENVMKKQDASSTVLELSKLYNSLGQKSGVLVVERSWFEFEKS